MSRMNDLAATLDALVTAATQLKMCAQDLITASNQLRAELEEPGSGEPDREPETKPKAQKPRAPKQPEPEAGPEPKADEPAPLPTKAEMRALLAGLADSGRRDEAKALVAKYAGGGSFSDIDPQRYPELAEEVKQYA